MTDAPLILAIDPGSENVGWCVGRGRTYIDSGRIRVGNGDAWDRLPRIFFRVLRMACEWGPDVIAAEEPVPVYAHKNPETDRKIISAFAAPLYVAALLGVEFVRVHPSSIRHTGFHKRARRDVALLIEAETGERPKKVWPDQADAVGVWAHVSGRYVEELFVEKWAKVVEAG